MRQSKRLLISLISAPIIAWCVYSFTAKIYSQKAEISINIKSYRNANLLMFYNNNPLKFNNAKSCINQLIASQFYKKLDFTIPTIKDVQFLRLDLGELPSQFFIESVELKIKGAFDKKTLKTWKGNNISSLFGVYHSAQIVSRNNMYIQINALNDDPYLVFNNSVSTEMLQYYNQNKFDLPQLLASIIISLFLICLVYFFAPIFIFSGIRNGSVLIVGMAFIIGLVFINNEFKFWEDAENDENRSMAAKPELKSANFFSYPDEISNYTRDNFSFRNNLFLFHAAYMANIFHCSPMPEDVIMGKEGWFFDTEPGDINDVRKMSPVSVDEIVQIHENLATKCRWLHERGIKFYVLVPPNKHMIYTEFLPKGYFVTKDIGVNRADFNTEHLKKHSNINFIYPIDALKQAKNRHEVYYKTDTHWNLYGGFIGYSELMKMIQKDFPYLKPAQEDDFIFSTFNSNEGDLAKVAGLKNSYGRTEILMTFKDTSKSLFLPKSSEITINYNNNKTIDGSNLKLVMLRDSYSNYLIPFLNLHFKKATYIWSYDFPDKLIEEEKPDVVIFESLQRFMSVAFTIPNPESVMSNHK
ncbi:MAG: hypothetical protein QM530_02725 [Phycisphaerales bacterium]|nr:hypothetical protein [Phycisphaerales bacterium]